MFNGKLYPSQIKAAEFLANKRQALLAWEQGTGKTIISIAAAEELMERGMASNALVLVPNSVSFQWEEKIREFTSSEVSRVCATDKTSRLYNQATKWTIVPYSLFRKDYDVISSNHYDIVIADEAQEFKNNSTKIARLLKSFNRSVPSRYRWALTGTAISNKLEELYSIFYWIDKEFLPPWPSFEKKHIVRNEYTNAIYSYKNLEPLNEYLVNRMDRKTHADMEGELPALVHQFYQLDPSKAYIRAEDALLNALDEMVDDLVFDQDGARFGRSYHPAVGKAFGNIYAELAGQDKISYVYNLISELRAENSTNKFVVFSRFKQPLYQLHAELGRHSVLFTGDQNDREKQEAVERFRDPEVDIFLASNAGYSGLDLNMANHLIHIDIPFSYALLDQRNKRITRLNSKFKTAVAHYIMMGIELFFYNQVIRKGELASAVQEGTADEVIIKPQTLRQWIMQQR